MRLYPGLRIGRWILVEKTRKGGHILRSLWLCHCDCGNEKVVDNGTLTAGVSRSCGCLREELRPTYRRTHGESKTTPEYRLWCHIRERCANPTCKAFRFYGARGIYVCDRWLESYENFLADMGRRPAPGYEIDRINTYGPYAPDNCRWLPKKLQARNIRSNRLITFNGEIHPLAEWSERTGINAATISFRIKMRWPLEKVFTHNPLIYHNRTADGTTRKEAA